MSKSITEQRLWSHIFSKHFKLRVIYDEPAVAKRNAVKVADATIEALKENGIDEKHWPSS